LRVPAFIRLRLDEHKGEPGLLRSRLRPLASSSLTLLLALALAVVLVALLAEDPGRALVSFFALPFSNAFFLGNALRDASLLMIAGLGSAIAFRGGAFNLGGEGQAYSGGLACAVACLALPSLPGPLGATLGLAAGMAVGGAVAGASGLLRWKLGVNELITSFLVSRALLPLFDFLLSGPLRDQGSAMLATAALPAAYALPRILPPSALSLLLPLALCLATLVWLFYSRSLPGFKARISGQSPAFAEVAGMRPGYRLFLAMLASGALTGLAGAGAVLGSSFLRCQTGFSAGLGWNAIAVALIARNNPLGVVPAALAFAFLGSGAQCALLDSNFGLDLGALVQALVFLLVTARLAPWEGIRQGLRLRRAGR
jgi:riboflavin transport system permease protein